jgi:hypothetical protein
MAGRPQDLGLGKAFEGLGPHPEPLFPIDASVDACAGDLGDLLLAPD